MKYGKMYTVISIIIALVLVYHIGFFFYYNYEHLLDFDAITYISQIPSLLGLAGVMLFYFSRFKRNNFLRWFMCYQIFSLPFRIWFDVEYFSGRPLKYYFNDIGPRLTVSEIVSTIILLLLTTSCAVGLWLLSKQKAAKLTAAEYDGKLAWEFSPAGKGLRFANRLIDIIVMLFIVINHLYTMAIYFDNSFNLKSYWELYLIEFVSIILYYLLLEGIFNTTPGKCVTNTTIVNEEGQRPRFGQILGRTFARLIPFDALSFLGARGWHDGLSGTYVVSAVNNEEATEEITLDAEQNIG
ncbi:MAG: RDD family protein [Bacteroidota bacterium]